MRSNRSKLSILPSASDASRRFDGTRDEGSGSHESEPRRSGFVFALGREETRDPFSSRYALRSRRDPMGTTRKDRARNDARGKHVRKLRVVEE